MKLKIIQSNKEESIEVGFWSFMKCTFLAQLALTGIIYGAILIIFLILFLIGLALGG